ncbi:MAG: VWA domain-containing protein [Armatimonadota bacterium]|nr:VWA domain-containing protein [Armatimonadota bacterium]MDR7548765.1 VWA domain-containing protein [Armatimonadota bacterium]
MNWKYPAFLWLLPALAGLSALSLAVLWRRQARGAVRYPLWIVAEAASHAGPIRRHLPAVFLILALAAAILGAAGPVVPWWTPTGWPVVLIIDVSRSMEEPDIPPSRIEATKAAALDFVARLPRATRAALVTFGNYATVVVPLTADRARMQEAIRGITTQLRTQLGNGLVEGVRAVAGEGGSSPGPNAAPGSGTRAIAILLSDGRASDGIPPLEAAEEARRRGVRVYTVGVGTLQDPSNFRSGYWGVLDEPTLRAIAAETGGQYFHAAEAGRLREIYRDLAGMVGWERRPTEVSAVAGGMAMALLVVSVVLRFLLFPMG